MRSKGGTRDGWTRVRFGDIAEQINDRVDDPNAAGVDRYVGLEHLDPGSLRVTRWGTPDEVSAQKLRFRPGDIIFGKRRAYQRKVAIADFEGICSAHAMVLRERVGATAPGFLIHFMASDVFMHRAVQISVGSLSPTINWTTLRDQEFDVPPIEEQRLVGHVSLLAAERVEMAKIAAEKSHSLFAAALRELLPPTDRHTRMVPLGDLYRVGTGGTPSRTQRDYWDGDIPWVKTGEVNYHTIRDTEESITVAGLTNSAAKVYPRGSVVMALFGQGPTLGRVARLGIDASTNQACAVIQSADADALELLFYWLWRQYKEIRGLARGATQPNLNVAIVKSLLVPTASGDPLRRTLKVLQALEHSAAQTNAYFRRVDNESRQLATRLLSKLEA